MIRPVPLLDELWVCGMEFRTKETMTGCEKSAWHETSQKIDVWQ